MRREESSVYNLILPQLQVDMLDHSVVDVHNFIDIFFVHLVLIGFNWLSREYSSRLSFASASVMSSDVPSSSLRRDYSLDDVLHFTCFRNLMRLDFLRFSQAKFEFLR
eukprot:CAMPEP_0196999408 /NCGR_PEP_ID=MMETSP1380-20130617/4600_1 /TAXON_ID=5936 /ORGANISM="Euplotes crassus, Strain CT5" /LENGTH=107 /DNA_ID=CAMNT_0042416329 /DNA_START=111 /DNA_END=434 /DNA_ORIENTATION=-